MKDSDHSRLTVLVPLIRDLVFVIPIGVLLLVVFGPVTMIAFALVGGTIRAVTTDVKALRKGEGRETRTDVF